MNYKPGTEVPATGVYWCTVCKRPERFDQGQQFPECRNLCGRGYWQVVKQPQQQADKGE